MKPLTKIDVPPLPVLNQTASPDCIYDFEQSPLSNSTLSRPRSRALSNVHAHVHSPLTLNRRRSIKDFFHSYHHHHQSKNQKQQKRRKSVIEWFSSRASRKNDEPITPTFARRRSNWKPSLEHLLEDSELLDALMEFMTKQYNEENLLFLLSVNALNHQIDSLIHQKNVTSHQMEEVDCAIKSIYETYIIEDGSKQINLSYACYSTVLLSKDRFYSFDLHEKRILFNCCTAEITSLIQKSIFYGFFRSDGFQSIAIERDIDIMPFIDDIRSGTMSETCALSMTSMPEMSPSLNGCYFSNKSVSNASMELFEEYKLESPSSISVISPVASELESSSDATPLVAFDSPSLCPLNHQRKFILCSRGFDHPTCIEWSIKILKCNDFRQEIGIISIFDQNLRICDGGVCDTMGFGARAVYGCNQQNNSFYYASYNANNKVRCKKDLSQLNVHANGWKSGDVIKVCLNLNKGNIKFYLNDTKVRKKLSVQKNTMYYPIIVWSGNCGYKVL